MHLTTVIEQYTKHTIHTNTHIHTCISTHIHTCISNTYIVVLYTHTCTFFKQQIFQSLIQQPPPTYFLLHSLFLWCDLVLMVIIVRQDQRPLDKTLFCVLTVTKGTKISYQSHLYAMHMALCYTKFSGFFA